VDDVVARQVIRKRTGDRLAGRRFSPRRHRRRDGFFEVLKLQLQLADPGQLLGRGAVGIPGAGAPARS
jgi:hypothetical protein